MYTPLDNVPDKVLCLILRFAGPMDMAYKKSLRLVCRAFGRCMGLILLSSLTFPHPRRIAPPPWAKLQPDRPDDEIVEFLHNHPHYSDNAEHLAVTRIDNVAHCVEFVQLCRSGTAVQSILWDCDRRIVPSAAYATILFFPMITLNARHLAPRILVWLMLEAPMLEHLSLRVKRFTQHVNAYDALDLHRDVVCALRQLEYHGDAVDDHCERLFGDSIATSFLVRGCSSLRRLYMSILPGDFPGVQAILTASCQTLRSLEVNFCLLLSSRPPPGHFNLAACTELRELSLTGHSQFAEFIGATLSTIPDDHQLEHIKLLFRDNRVDPPTWAGLYRACLRICDKSDLEWSVLLDGQDVPRAKDWLQWMARGRSHWYKDRGTVKITATMRT